MIKVVITNNNDIWNDSLSTIALENESKIEVINVDIDKLDNFICHLKTKHTLIILDSNTTISFCCNIIKNAIYLKSIEKNIIILIVDSKKLSTNLKKHEHIRGLLNRNINFSVFDIISLIANSIKDTLQIEEKIDDILWKLGFVSSFKGTMYLKDAILFAYYDETILQDMDIFVKKISEKHKVLNEKNVRYAMNKTLSAILDYKNNDIIHTVFGDDYDGRKISLKYFIDLCVRNLKKQKLYCKKKLTT